MTDLTLSEFKPDRDQGLGELLKEEASKMYGSTPFLPRWHETTHELSLFSRSLSMLNSLFYRILQSRHAHRA
jgi:hypothetical protein